MTIKTPLKEAAIEAQKKCQAAALDSIDSAEALKHVIKASIQKEMDEEREAEKMASGVPV